MQADVHRNRLSEAQLGLLVRIPARTAKVFQRVGFSSVSGHTDEMGMVTHHTLMHPIGAMPKFSPCNARHRRLLIPTRSLCQRSYQLPEVVVR